MSIQAFHGAYGWGAEATGGQGGIVIHVTNPNSSGPGSFKEAIDSFDTRSIVFDVTGKIDLGGDINLDRPNVSIDGQEVYLTGGRLIIRCQNVIVRNLAWRGDGVALGFIALRPFLGADIKDVIIDHCSSAWNMDDVLDIWHEGGSIAAEIHHITIQNSLFAEPDAGHPTTSMIRGDYNNGGWDKIHHISYHNNLHVNTGYRNPYIFSQHSEVLNNVVYNWGWYPIGFGDEAEVDIVNNYLKPGPLGGPSNFSRDNEYGDNPMSVYIEGNVIEGIKLASDDDWPYIKNEFAPGGNPDEATHRRLSPLAQPAFPVPIVSAAKAYTNVLASVGLDAFDALKIQEVINDTGPSSLVDSPGVMPPEGGIMSVVDDLIAVELALRAEAVAIIAQADAVAQVVVDLQAVDDVLDAAADVIEVD